VGCRSGHLIAPVIGMEYDKMKAFMEASREESAVQRKPDKLEVKDFPKPDSRLSWKYLDYVAKDLMAA
jgi:hypothetical protein